MRVESLSAALGAELCDFDVSRPCNLEEQAELRAVFTEYHLLAVRDQSLTAEDQDRFVGYFGPLGGDIYVTNKEPPRSGNTGHGPLVWHADGMWDPQPGIATSLWALEVSPHATPTLFANGVRVLDRLPVDLRAQVDSLHAVYLRAAGNSDANYRRVREVDMPPEGYRTSPVRAEHPIVYQLPHMQKKALYVDQLMTSHIVEFSPDESEALLQELHKYIYADDNVYAHNWRTRDLIIWDNIALQHARPTEMGGETRHLRRQTIVGWNTDDGVLDWGPGSHPGY